MIKIIDKFHILYDSLQSFVMYSIEDSVDYSITDYVSDYMYLEVERCVCDFVWNYVSELDL